MMKRKILVTTAACVLIASCVTPPPPVAVAPAAAATDIRAEAMLVVAMEREAHMRERDTMMQRIQELGSELAVAKSRADNNTEVTDGNVASAVAAATAATEPNATAESAPVAPVPQKITITRPKLIRVSLRGPASANTAPPNRETIVIRDSGMIFRVMHNFARTEFNPSKSLREQLLQAARAGKTIEIRGRTDAVYANDADRYIAMQRALNARVFLANNGIHPRKMHINYLSAGDHVADNGTAEGRARNRRVDIETAGITPDVLEDMASVIRQDLQ